MGYAVNMNKYEKIVREDLALVGFYKLWDRAWEDTGFDLDTVPTAELMDKLFKNELNKRKLTKGRFITAVRKYEADERASKQLRELST